MAHETTTITLRELETSREAVAVRLSLLLGRWPTDAEVDQARAAMLAPGQAITCRNCGHPAASHRYRTCAGQGGQCWCGGFVGTDALIPGPDRVDTSPPTDREIALARAFTDAYAAYNERSDRAGNPINGETELGAQVAGVRAVLAMAVAVDEGGRHG